MRFFLITSTRRDMLENAQNPPTKSDLDPPTPYLNLVFLKNQIKIDDF